ncbi:MAG: hypothetical protein LBM39_03635 [Candidatus Methanoplasma sp.]|nr:hypothetical protein [Candidatus Methanoplasma sp.]
MKGEYKVILSILVVVLAIAVFASLYEPDGGDDNTVWDSSTPDKVITPVPGSNNYAISLLSSAGGTTSGGGAYKSGSYVTIKAMPNNGYEFGGWYEDGTILSTSPNYQFLCSANKTITPLFNKLSFSVSIFSNYPSAGTFTGDGTYPYETVATLNATITPGYLFSGWYVNGVSVSSSQNAKYTVVGNASIESRYAINHDASFSVSKTSSLAPSTVSTTSKYNVEISSRTWNTIDLMTGSTIGNQSYSGNSGNAIVNNYSSGRALSVTQTVVYSDGYKSTYTEKIVIDEIVSKHYEWNYQQKAWHSILTSWIWNNKTAKWDVPLSFDTYYKYHVMERSYARTQSSISNYITSNDLTIQNLVRSLNDLTSEMSDLERVNCVLKFVQSIPYVFDIDNKGVNEYWNYPVETLWEKKGDCDDHAILFATLIKAMGYKVAIFILPGHMAAGVSVPDASGTYVEYGGIKYFYCEATALVGGDWVNQANVGYMPPQFTTVSIYVV